jgi:hypothetical protein
MAVAMSISKLGSDVKEIAESHGKAIKKGAETHGKLLKEAADNHGRHMGQHGRFMGWWCWPWPMWPNLL